MSAPWNKGVTQKWIAIDYSDVSTFPHVGQKVIAVDHLCKQAICIFDKSKDFIYDASGFDAKEISSVLKDVVYGVIEKLPGLLSDKARDELKKLFFEEDASCLCEEVVDLVEQVIDDEKPAAYFAGVMYWMPAPPSPEMIEELDGAEGAEQVTFLTYDLMTAIEPSIRQAIKAVLAQRQGEET